MRAYGYTFYSDWYLTPPSYAASGGATPAFPETAQYQLITHTAGGALSFQDQLNDQNLITLDGNYTVQATVIRFNNSTANGGTSPIGYMAPSNGHGGFTCFGYTDGNSPSGTFGFDRSLLGSSSYYDVASGG